MADNSGTLVSNQLTASASSSLFNTDPPIRGVLSGGGIERPERPDNQRMRVKEIPLDDIKAPSTSTKLHPVADEISQEDTGVSEENADTWENFVESVNQELQKPLEVTEEDGHYRLVDGDRRLRALEQGGSETAECMIKESKEDGEVFVNMLRANEFRKPNNKTRRAQLVAQLCQPWLLPPGERDQDTRRYLQTELADEIGVSDATISNWITPIQVERHRLRDVIVDVARPLGRDIDPDISEQVDRIRDLLTTPNDDGQPMLSVGMAEKTHEKLDETSGLGLEGLETIAEKGVAEGWDNGDLKEHLDEHYVHTTEMDEAETGMMGDTDFEDDLSGGVTTDDVEQDQEDEEASAEQTARSGPEWEVPVSPDVEQTIDKLDAGQEARAQKMLTENFEDASAVAVNALADRYDREISEVMDEFVEPLVTHAAIAAESDPETFQEVIEKLESI